LIDTDKIVRRTTGREQQNKQAYYALFLGVSWVNEEARSGANAGKSFRSRDDHRLEINAFLPLRHRGRKKADGVMLRLEHVREESTPASNFNSGSSAHRCSDLPDHVAPETGCSDDANA
jgi:hypothetical protein